LYKQSRMRGHIYEVSVPELLTVLIVIFISKQQTVECYAQSN